MSRKIVSNVVNLKFVCKLRRNLFVFYFNLLYELANEWRTKSVVELAKKENGGKEVEQEILVAFSIFDKWREFLLVANTFIK